MPFEFVEKLWSYLQLKRFHRDEGKSSCNSQQRLFSRQCSHVLVPVEWYEAGNAAALERLCGKR
jgi:hypothetical protein